jgi:hypothetical protein
VAADLHEDLVITVKESTQEIERQYPSDSFQRVFWEQQRQAMEKSNSRSMRWEPAMIRFVSCTFPHNYSHDIPLYIDGVSICAISPALPMRCSVTLVCCACPHREPCVITRITQTQHQGCLGVLMLRSWMLPVS